jgi:hypothetical protein
MNFPREAKSSAFIEEYEQARQLFEEHYNTLRQRARGILWRDPCATINVTGLVHEAYLKITRNRVEVRMLVKTSHSF